MLYPSVTIIVGIMETLSVEQIGAQCGVCVVENAIKYGKGE